MKILITGVAGFIGSNVAKALLARFSDAMVIGVDSLDGYYDPQLKNERLRELQDRP